MLCIDMDAYHLVLLYHTQTRWLSKGNVTRRFFELKVKAFCELKSKSEFCSSMEDKEWMLFLTYLSDIFEQLNELNLQMQGKNININKFANALNCKIGNEKSACMLTQSLRNWGILLDHRENRLPV